MDERLKEFESEKGELCSQLTQAKNEHRLKDSECADLKIQIVELKEEFEANL